THQDDVADHAKFAQRFGCERMLHRDDIRSATAMIERQPTGRDAIEIERDVIMIPTPGHTRGHAVLLYKNRFFFTGDHLAWNERTNHLYAFPSACWYSWPEQSASMSRLLDITFEWMLPGDARPSRLRARALRAGLARCVMA